MIHTLPQSLIDSATKMLTEALASSAHKAMATKASKESTNADGLTAAERISKDVIPVGTDRIVIPLSRTSTPDPQVVNHLSSHGYHVDDYTSGLAHHESTPNRKMRIGRIMNMVGAPENIRTAFEKDPARQGIKSSASIVITRKPYDVAAMSTHQTWQSCQTLGGKATLDGFPTNQEKGSHSDMVPGIVKSGAHMAYLVNDPKDIDQHYKPIARVTLNAYSNGKGHNILRPTGQVYGDEWEGFHETVSDWAEKHFPTKSPTYVRHRSAYGEGPDEINDYSSQHDDYWKDHGIGNPPVMRHHPNKEILHHFTQHVVENAQGSSAAALLSNPNLSGKDADRLINNFADGPHARQISHYAKTPAHIATFMDKNMGNYGVARVLVRNDNATGAQLHELIDTYGLGKKSAVGKREPVHWSHSPAIMDRITNNKNANETHFDKMFEYTDLMDHGASTPEQVSARFGANMDYSDSLENIARRYHSEDIGRKLIASQYKQPNILHSVIYDVAEKHPHLLGSVDDKDIARSLRNHGNSKALQKIALERNTGVTLSALASNTEDREILGKLKQHPDYTVSRAAELHEMLLDKTGK